MARYTWDNILQKNKSGNVSAIIADDNNIIDPSEIAQNFNNFFTSVGTNLQKKIPPTKKNFTDYLKKPNSENFIIAPTTSDEISDLTKIMKISKEIISLPLSQQIKSNCT